MKEQTKHLGVENPRRINWFPGHMAKALKEVAEKLKAVDVICEVRDARLPLSSGNDQLIKSVGAKHRLILLNKINLASEENLKEWRAYFKASKEPVIFINALNPKTMKQIVPEAKKLMTGSWERFKKKGIRPPNLRLMIIGVPNTGKSTIINRLAGKKSTKTGDKPGVTRQQEWVLLAQGVELLDTPGIMTPRIDDDYTGLALSAIYAIRDEIAGPRAISLYLLRLLLEQKPEAFMDRYGIGELQAPEGGFLPEHLVEPIGLKMGLIKKAGEVDDSRVYQTVLNDYRRGSLGVLVFEVPPERTEDDAEEESDFDC